ncbi:hypothetical protein F0562_004405 [Nyssa sinensis]|uniref:EF-hand domain-containing protein n=1 Tax=Nyssa sinensis TaxID=561372 RepID=A0A5J5BZA2_9ASTE|nr:hypothetical protein F0562_004405 [Nyssa sinensis]
MSNVTLMRRRTRILSSQTSSLPPGRRKMMQICVEKNVEMLMEELGIFCHPDAEKLPERLSSSDLSNLFEEEPSFDEVKEAFDVFDENRDGFIDAGELQRVLRVLGFKDGIERENCRRMIATFDENGDGRIDFKEFVKFMENSLC